MLSRGHRLVQGVCLFFLCMLDMKIQVTSSLGKASKKKVQKFGHCPNRGEGGTEIRCNVQTFLNVEKMIKWPKITDLIDKRKENIDHFGAKFCQFQA